MHSLRNGVVILNSNNAEQAAENCGIYNRKPSLLTCLGDITIKRFQRISILDVLNPDEDLLE